LLLLEPAVFSNNQIVAEAGEFVNGVSDLRKARVAADVTQFELAKKSGIERTRISLAENGHVELRPEEYKALMRALVEVIRYRVSELQGVLSGQAQRT
jgi:predicted transcriptional regulator